MKLTLVLFTVLVATGCAHKQQTGESPYMLIERRIAALTNVDREVIGQITEDNHNYDIHALIFPPKKGGPSRKKNILITAGVHGDEPAGVHAVLEFLEKEAANYKDIRFYVFPCVNPSGIDKNRAQNAQNENINRKFVDGSTNQEAALVIKKLKAWNTRFTLALDLHEVPHYWAEEGWTEKDNPREAYLYETQTDPSKRIGRKMIDALPADIEVSSWPSIYGDKAEKGLITYPEGNLNQVYAAGTSLDAYIQRNYSKHTFTTETPISWPLEKRIRTHLSWLKTALML
jgi:murein peptide amidase A